MLIDRVTFPSYSIYVFFAFFALNWVLIYRKICFSFFDPLNLTTNFTFAGGATIYLTYFLSGSRLNPDAFVVPLLIIFSLGCMALLGFVFPLKNRAENHVPKTGSMPKGLVLTISSALALYGISVLLFVSKYGITALSENPLDSKLMYAGGGGAFRRLVEISTQFTQIGLLVGYVSRRKLGFFFLFVMVSIMSSLLVVSKSVLLSYFFLLFFLLDCHGRSELKKYLYPLLPIGIIFTFFMIYSAIRSVIPTAGMNEVTQMLTTRIIAYGDTFFYLMTSKAVVREFWMDDLTSLVTTNLSSLLAPARIISWDDVASTGSRIYLVIEGYSRGIGPNATTWVEGWLFLRWYAFLYIIGTVSFVFWVRHIAMRYIISENPYFVFLGFVVFSGATSVFTDGAYWGTSTVSLLMGVAYASIVYCLSLISDALLTKNLKISIGASFQRG